MLDAFDMRLERLLRIENTCFKQDRLSKRSLRHFLKNDQIHLDAGGFIIFIRYKYHTRIYNLAVLPAYRGLGIARRLIGFLGGGEIRLECKPHLKRFYEKLGFKVIGEKLNYYENGERCLRMRREYINGLGKVVRR